MAFNRATLAVLMLALVSASTMVGAEETIREARVEATLPQSGTVIGVGFDSLWMMDTATNKKLVRIHIDDNSVTEIPISGAVGPFLASGLAIGEDAIWVPDLERAMIYKVDPRTNRVVKELPADVDGVRGPTRKYAIAAGEGAVWAITSKNELKRYSAKDGGEEATIALPSRSRGVIVAFGHVWITGLGNDELYRVDPATNHIVATIDLGSHPVSIVAGEGSVWVHNEGDGTVQRIDGKSGNIVATIETGAVGDGAIAVGGGFVWVSTHNEPIIQIDPHTNAVRGKFKIPMDEYSTIAFGGGSLWISGGSVRRIKPPE
jgi:virginiamycin B lyase